jgi:hypothetical protein
VNLYSAWLAEESYDEEPESCENYGAHYKQSTVDMELDEVVHQSP